MSKIRRDGTLGPYGTEFKRLDIQPRRFLERLCEVVGRRTLAEEADAWDGLFVPRRERCEPDRIDRTACNPAAHGAHPTRNIEVFSKRTTPLKARRSIGTSLKQFAVGALLLLQVNLLLAAALHRHGPAPNPVPVREHFCPAGEHLSTAVLPEAVCVTCLTIRHSTPRPRARSSSQLPAVQSQLRVLAPARRFESFNWFALYGRAPPLS